jgi:hypothetical protein
LTTNTAFNTIGKNIATIIAVIGDSMPIFGIRKIDRLTIMAVVDITNATAFHTCFL